MSQPFVIPSRTPGPTSKSTHVLQSERVLVVIVNYRTAAFVVRALASIERSLDELQGGSVMVVDNDSRDGSGEAIRAAIREHGWERWASVLRAPVNGGFGYGNNLGYRHSMTTGERPAMVLFLNPDTELRVGVISTLRSRLLADPSIGIVGSAIENQRGEPSAAAHNIHSPLSELESAARLGLLSKLLVRWSVTPPQSDRAHRCGWVSGACMGVRPEVLAATGGFDEGFFLYFEEVDLCARAARLGWQCWFEPSVRVMHLEGASTGIAEAKRPKPAYWYASRRRLLVKLYGIAGLVAADLLWIVGRATLVVRRTLMGSGHASGRLEPRMARDMLSSDFKAIISGNARVRPHIQ